MQIDGNLASHVRRIATLFLATLLLVGAIIAAPGTASAATCVATGDWHANCTQQQGDSNNLVLAIQDIILQYGAIHNLSNCLIEPDGDFGPDTTTGVKCFQNHTGLQVDGIVGPATWASLRQEIHQVGPPQDLACDPKGWCYYRDDQGFSQAPDFRQWSPSGIWYVRTDDAPPISATYGQMNSGN